MSDPEFRPKWENRRKVIFGTLVYCAAMLPPLAFLGEGEVAETVAMGLVLLAAGTIGSYVFGASWEYVRLGGK
jgi:hypothetical protein